MQWKNHNHSDPVSVVKNCPLKIHIYLLLLHCQLRYLFILLLCSSILPLNQAKYYNQDSIQSKLNSLLVIRLSSLLLNVQFWSLIILLFSQFLFPIWSFSLRYRSSRVNRVLFINKLLIFIAPSTPIALSILQMSFHYFINSSLASHFSDIFQSTLNYSLLIHKASLLLLVQDYSLNKHTTHLIVFHKS